MCVCVCVLVSVFVCLCLCVCFTLVINATCKAKSKTACITLLRLFSPAEKAHQNGLTFLDYIKHQEEVRTKYFHFDEIRRYKARDDGNKRTDVTVHLPPSGGTGQPCA